MSKKKTIAFLAGGTALAAGITAHVLRKKAEKTIYKKIMMNTRRIYIDSLIL